MQLCRFDSQIFVSFDVELADKTGMRADRHWTDDKMTQLLTYKLWMQFIQFIIIIIIITSEI